MNNRRLDNIPSGVHDGLLTAISIEEDVFDCKIKLENGSTVSLTLDGVIHVCVNHFYRGNIVFDVRIVESTEAENSDIEEYFDEDIRPEFDEFVTALKTKEAKLMLIGSSYGAMVGVAFSGDVITQE